MYISQTPSKTQNPKNSKSLKNENEHGSKNHINPISPISQLAPPTSLQMATFSIYQRKKYELKAKQKNNLLSPPSNLKFLKVKAFQFHSSLKQH